MSSWMGAVDVDRIEVDGDRTKNIAPFPLLWERGDAVPPMGGSVISLS